MRILRSRFHQVACFDHVEFEFPEKREPTGAETHLLVGPNGTGKTTALLGLAQFFSYGDTGIQRRFRGPDAFVHVATTSGSENVEPGHRPAVTRPSDNVHEGVHRYRAEESQAPLSGGGELEFAAFAYTGQRTLERAHLMGIRELEDRPFAGALQFPGTTGQADRLVQWIANVKVKEALARDRNDEEKAKRWRSATSQIEHIVRTMTDSQDFEFLLYDDPLKVRVRYAGAEVDFDVLPDGLKSILSWISDLLMRMDRAAWASDTPVLERPFVLFLDEIEAHLHPAWQRKVLPVVRELFPNAQVFLATHSPFVIASARGAWIHRLSAEANGVSVKPPLLAEVGASFSSVLHDVMGIRGEFSLEVEALFDKFYAAKREVLAGDQTGYPRFLQLADELGRTGPEVRSIAEHERRYVDRLRKREGAA
jgi:hypothetical protein